jgi:hypothetical protein
LSEEIRLAVGLADLSGRKRSVIARRERGVTSRDSRPSSRSVSAVLTYRSSSFLGTTSDSGRMGFSRPSGASNGSSLELASSIPMRSTFSDVAQTAGVTMR